MPRNRINRNGHDRSPFAGFRDPILSRHNAQLVANVIQSGSLAGNDTSMAGMSRMIWSQSGMTHGEPDPRTNVHVECGWPQVPPPELLNTLFLTDSIAARVVEFMSKEAWQVIPTIKDGEDEIDETPFLQSLVDVGDALNGGEENWYEPGEGNPLFSEMQQADILSGIGSYGILYLGFDDVESDDDLAKPVKGLEEIGSRPAEKPTDKTSQIISANGAGKYLRHRIKRDLIAYNADDTSGNRQLLFTQAYPEFMARVLEWETNENSPRRGWPVRYQINQLNNDSIWSGSTPPLKTLTVHWTRCIHMADWHHHPGPSKVIANSRMRCVLPEILDGRKISGADGVAFWRNALLKIFLETHPQLGGDTLFNRADAADDFENMMNGLQQWMFLRGMHANPVAPTVVDPSPHQDAKIQRICIKGGWPTRIFVGSERGNLASTQDESQHTDRVAEHERNYESPAVVGPTLNRLILVGVCAEPASGKYTISWPPVGTQDELKKAQVLLARTQAAAAFVSGNVGSLIPEKSYLVDEMGLSEEKADEYLAEAEKAVLEEEQKNAALADEHGMIPEVPGFQPKPEDQPIAPVKMGPGHQLVQPDTGKTIAKAPFPPKAARNEDDTENAFCATGEGGGVDPSCSTGGGGGGGLAGVPESNARLPKPPEHWQKYALRDHPELKDKKFEMRLVPLSSVKPSQTGDDYINDSSRGLAKAMKIVEKEGQEAINRSADYWPIVVDKTGNIIDGNHRHAAHSINKYKHIWAMVEQPREGPPARNEEKAPFPPKALAKNEEDDDPTYNYSPEQARDAEGQWTSDGGGLDHAAIVRQAHDESKAALASGNTQRYQRLQSLVRKAGDYGKQREMMTTLGKDHPDYARYEDANKKQHAEVLKRLKVLG